MLLATCCEDDIVPHVLPFIKEHIKNPDWRYRDAAVMAFGCILEGPEPSQLKPLVIQAMPTLIELMKDPSVVVRDTAAWTVGRICELLPEAAINDVYLAPLLQCLIEGLSAEPRVASNVCWAFSSLAEAAYEAADVADDQEEPATYCLSSSFELIVQKLLETTDRPDGHQNNLRSSAYESLMEIVKTVPRIVILLSRKRLWSSWNDYNRCFRWSHISRAHPIESSSMTFSLYSVQLFRMFFGKCNIKMLCRSLMWLWPPC